MKRFPPKPLGNSEDDDGMDRIESQAARGARGPAQAEASIDGSIGESPIASAKSCGYPGG